MPAATRAVIAVRTVPVMLYPPVGSSRSPPHGGIGWLAPRLKDPGSLPPGSASVRAAPGECSRAWAGFGVQPGGGSTDARRRGTPCVAETVLYIDDAPELPPGAADALLGVGYRLVHTSDPEQGLRLARDRAPRVVLLEVLLRSGDGLDLIERIRSWEGAPGRVPIVILTRAGRTPELYGRALELGVDDFLCKPVLRADLLAAVLECGEHGDAVSPLDPTPADPRQASADDFTGDLAESPLPDLLYRLHRIGATGVLVVQHEAESRAIQLRNGSPIAVASNRGTETLEDFLVRTKRISGAEHETLMERVEAGLGNAREILVAMGFLGEAELEAAIRERAAEPLLEGFGWPSGSYRFEPGKRMNPGQALDLERSPARLLFEGVLQWSPSDMIRGLLRRRAPFYVSKAERPPHPLEELGRAADSAAALETLLGDRSVAEVLESGEIAERVLYGLLVTRFVEVHPEPVLLLRDMLTPGPRAVRQMARPAPPRPAPSEPKVEEPAPVDVASAIAGLRRRGQEGRDAEAGASRRLEAESWFRKGEVFLSRKLHADAVEAFGMAAHLDPQAGEYRAFLGYVLHLSNPRNELVRREALEHIATGIKLSPDRERPLLFLGRVFKAAGELENARKVFRRALKIKPDCHEAQSELRLLKLRQPKQRSWIDRLRGR